MDDRETIVDREAEIKGLEEELRKVKMELEKAKDYGEEEHIRRIEAEKRYSYADGYGTGMERVLQMFDLLKKEN